jgi:site-specific recombinase XerC
MFGHSSLEMTRVHTQVSIQHLEEVHRQTHPAAKLGRTPDERDLDPAPR